MEESNQYGSMYENITTLFFFRPGRRIFSMKCWWRVFVFFIFLFQPQQQKHRISHAFIILPEFLSVKPIPCAVRHSLSATRLLSTTKSTGISLTNNTYDFSADLDYKTNNNVLKKSLADRLKFYVNTDTPITLIGYIIGKRQLSKHLIFLDFLETPGIGGGSVIDDYQDHYYLHSKHICQLLLKKEDFILSSNEKVYLYYQKCLQIGTKIKVTGKVIPTDVGNMIFSIQTIELSYLPRQVQHIEIILKQAATLLYVEQPNDPNIDIANISTRNLSDVETDPLGYDILNELSMACQLENVFDLEEKLREAAAADNRAIADTRLSSRKLKYQHQKPWRNLAKDIFAGLSNDLFYPKDWIDERIIAKRRNLQPDDQNAISIYPSVTAEAPDEWRNIPSFVAKLEDVDCNLVEHYGKDKSISTVDINGDKYQAIKVEGWVQNRRRFQDNITVFHLVSEEDATDTGKKIGKRLHCIMHPKNLSCAGVYRNLAAAGAKVSVQGVLKPSSTSGNNQHENHCLWIQSIRLLRSTDRPATIHHLLQLVDKKVIRIDEAADALLLKHSVKMEIAAGISATTRKWKANQISAALQQRHQQMKKSCSSADKKMIDKYKDLLKKYECNATTLFQEGYGAAANKDRFRRITTTGMPGTRWETKKRPQIEWIAQRIQEILLEHPDYGKRKISILDIGGGKGLLANYLSHNIENIKVHVVDKSPGAIANGQKKFLRAQNQKYDSPPSTVDFKLEDASRTLLKEVKADIVVALHACGHLTDIALSHAIHRKASFVITPCCFKSNSHLSVPAAPGEPPIPVHEWLGVSEDDWSRLRIMAEVQGDAISDLGMKLICGIRARAVEERLKAMQSNESNEFEVKLLSFPVEYSTRNKVLVGKVFSDSVPTINTS